MVKIFKAYFSIKLSLVSSFLLLVAILFFNSTPVYADENSGRMAVVLQQNTKDIFVRQNNTGDTFVIEFPGSDNSEEINPALSRDGSMIAFATNNNDLFPNDDGFNIVVFMLDGPSAGKVYPITTMHWNGVGHDETWPTWDPSGGKIAYQSFPLEGLWDNPGSTEEIDIFYRDVFETMTWYDGVETDFDRWETEKPSEISLTKIGDGVSNFQPAWNHAAPDSIAYVSDRDDTWQVYVLFGIGVEGEDPGLGGIMERRVSNHPEADSDNSEHPELIIFSYDLGNFGRDDCKDGAEAIFYEGGPDIFMACVGEDGEYIYTNWVRGSYPKLMPGSNSLAFVSDGAPSVYIKTGPSGEHNEVWPSTVVEGFSWSGGGSGTINIGEGEDDTPDLSVNVFGGSVELSTGDLFGGDEDQREQEYARIDSEIQLEIRRIESYKAQSEAAVEMERRRIEFEKESFYEKIEFTKREFENNYESSIRGWGDDNDEGQRNQRERELEELTRNFSYEIEKQEQDLERHGSDFERAKKNLEEQHEFGLAQWEIQLKSEEERLQFDNNNWIRDFQENRDWELEEMKRYYSEEKDRVKLDYQWEINNRIANDEGIEDLINDRDWQLQDWEIRENDEINNFAAESSRTIETQKNDWVYQAAQRREQKDRNIEDDKRNKEREMEDFLFNWEINTEERTNSINSMKRDLQDQIENFNVRWDSNERDWQRQKELAIEHAQMEKDGRIQDMDMEIERAEMEWEAQIQRTILDTQRAMEDFEYQIDQMIQEGERRKEMVSMDQQQLVDEYSGKQDVLLSRREQIEHDYGERVNDANQGREDRLMEVENRRQHCMDAGCELDEIREILEIENGIELDYQEQLANAEGDYNREYSQWEFEMRNVSDVIEMGQREDVYNEGERGFFANPIAGTIKTGDGAWDERLRDPGFLAMAGLAVTVGATLLQMFRGN